jgi:hypothetical protein
VSCRFWFPDYLFTSLSTFAFITWIVPNNQKGEPRWSSVFCPRPPLTFLDPFAFLPSQYRCASSCSQHALRDELGSRTPPHHLRLDPDHVPSFPVPFLSLLRDGTDDSAPLHRYESAPLTTPFYVTVKFAPHFLPSFSTKLISWICLRSCFAAIVIFYIFVGPILYYKNVWNSAQYVFDMFLPVFRPS